MSTENQLEVLFPEGKALTLQGTELIIKPFKFGKLPQVFRTLQPVADIFAQLAKEDTNQFTLITGLIAHGGDNIVELLVIGSNQPKEWVNELDADEGIKLLTAIIEVNSSFFIQKILPQLTQTLEAVNGQMS